jgi:hypothetical protein
MAGGPSGILALPSARRGVALQDALALQVIETPEDIASRALQDALRCQGPVLIGLIAHLSDSALQDDIASTTRGLLQLGQDILSGGTISCPTNECCALSGCVGCRRSSAGSINGWCATGTSSAAMSQALALYLVLVTVADAQGLSYYGEASLARLLSMPAARLIQARRI